MSRTGGAQGCWLSSRESTAPAVTGHCGRSRAGRRDGRCRLGSGVRGPVREHRRATPRLFSAVVSARSEEVDIGVIDRGEVVECGVLGDRGVGGDGVEGVEVVGEGWPVRSNPAWASWSRSDWSSSLIASSRGPSAAGVLREFVDVSSGPGASCEGVGAWRFGFFGGAVRGESHGLLVHSSTSVLMLLLYTCFGFVNGFLLFLFEYLTPVLCASNLSSTLLVLNFAVCVMVCACDQGRSSHRGRWWPRRGACAGASRV